MTPATKKDKSGKRGKKSSSGPRASKHDASSSTPVQGVMDPVRTAQDTTPQWALEVSSIPTADNRF